MPSSSQRDLRTAGRCTRRNTLTEEPLWFTHSNPLRGGAGALRNCSPKRGWEANRPKHAVIHAKMSQRAVKAPVRTSHDKLQQRTAQAYRSSPGNMEGDNTGGDNAGSSGISRAQNLWSFVKKRLITNGADPSPLPDSPYKLPSHTDFVRIQRGSRKVLFSELLEIRKYFDKMNPDQDGLVSYNKLLKDIKSKIGVDTTKMKSKLMSRSGNRFCAGAEEDGREGRLALNMFNFLDLLRFRYPSASFDDLQHMSKMVSPARLAFHALTTKEIGSAVKLFRDIDVAGTGTITYGPLETALIKKFPAENIYKVIKTMDSDMLDRLYLGGSIHAEEFVMWYAGALAKKSAIERAEKMQGGKDSIDPSAVFNQYLEGHHERMYLRNPGCWHGLIQSPSFRAEAGPFGGRR
eukprot:CAMPEP_0117654844 /NCGR_PEP_ID=MMETSP0804-20121206/3963_1 /TAXON_ID=1074897 /ORGANISM="Tetraselmis astigmatica, Strain CCMP880" /LENGTH=404 /DNA_ID=CAMNT_0005461157 /DNA_START=897 /DNA_END=2111 /DNA_ORIENTATION=+